MILRDENRLEIPGTLDDILVDTSFILAEVSRQVAKVTGNTQEEELNNIVEATKEALKDMKDLSS